MIRRNLLVVLNAIERFGRWLGEVTSWLVLCTLVSVLAAVIGMLGRLQQLFFAPRNSVIKVAMQRW